MSRLPLSPPSTGKPGEVSEFRSEFRRIPGTLYLIFDHQAGIHYHENMARMARVAALGLPHHITQRGNRRMETFFAEADYREYLYLMAEWCNRCEVQIWSYCLMPNHSPYCSTGVGRRFTSGYR